MFAYWRILSDRASHKLCWSILISNYHISCIFRAYFVLIEFRVDWNWCGWRGVCVYQSRVFKRKPFVNPVRVRRILNCRECFKWCVCVSKWCMGVPRVCCTKWGECTDTNYDTHTPTHHLLCTRARIMKRTHHFHVHTPLIIHTRRGLQMASINYHVVWQNSQFNNIISVCFKTLKSFNKFSVIYNHTK